jgi:hypothetical protein
VSFITAIIYCHCRLTGNHLPTATIFYRDTSRTIYQVQSSRNPIMLLATILSRQRCRTYLARSTQRPVNTPTPNHPNINTSKKTKPHPHSPSFTPTHTPSLTRQALRPQTTSSRESSRHGTKRAHGPPQDQSAGRATKKTQPTPQHHETQRREDGKKRWTRGESNPGPLPC